MAMNLIKDKALQAAKPENKDKGRTLNDGGGLTAYVRPDGTKQWLFRYTFDGKRRKTTFGTYPTVRIKDARQKREKKRKTDPKSTIGAVCARELEQRKARYGLKETTINRSMGRFERYLFLYWNKIILVFGWNFWEHYSAALSTPIKAF